MASGALRSGAAFLSLVIPGAGHALLGRLGRGVVLFVALVLALVSSAWTPWGACTGVAVLLVTSADTFFVRPGPRQSTGRIVWAIASLAVALHLGFRTEVRVYIVENFKVTSDAMSPTLIVGDHIFVRKLPFTARRGDVVALFSSEHTVVQRVGGVAGDTVATKTGPVTVPAGHIYAASDNAAAHDQGLVAESDISGLVISIWFSQTADAEIRWDRAGATVR